MERKPGKQPGSKGKNLAQVTNPDQVIIHVPEACDSCGADLYGAKVISEEVRLGIRRDKAKIGSHRTSGYQVSVVVVTNVRLRFLSKPEHKPAMDQELEQQLFI